MRTALCFFLVLLSASVSAIPITGLFNTGVDGSGTVLPNNSADPHYAMLAPSQAAVVVNSASIPGTWLANDANSRWIWETSNGQPVNVTRTFRTTFDLTGFDLASVLIAGRWSTDNSGLDIVLNGTSTGQTASGFTSWFGFSLASGFVAGLNTLDFVVRDAGVISGFRAEFLRAEGELSSGTDVPEPMTAALTALGLLGLRSRRKARH